MVTFGAIYFGKQIPHNNNAEDVKMDLLKNDNKSMINDGLEPPNDSNDGLRLLRVETLRNP